MSQVQIELNYITLIEILMGKVLLFEKKFTRLKFRLIEIIILNRKMLKKN